MTVCIHLVMLHGMGMTVQVETHVTGHHSPSEVLNVNLICFVVANDEEPVMLVDCSELFVKPCKLRITVLSHDVIVKIALL